MFMRVSVKRGRRGFLYALLDAAGSRCRSLISHSMGTAWE
jgi:hypothetical protein